MNTGENYKVGKQKETGIKSLAICKVRGLEKFTTFKLRNFEDTYRNEIMLATQL